MSTSISGWRSRSAAHVSRPGSSGMSRSSRTTSGARRWASARASRPSRARPATATRGSARSSAAVPSRIRRWSSTTSTETGGSSIAGRKLTGAGAVATEAHPPAAVQAPLAIAAVGSVARGVVAAAQRRPLALEETGATVLAILGDLLGAGIAAARLRQRIARAEVERERVRLAADIHDGLAQDLALAKREIALLDSEPSPEHAAESRARLREAVGAAHRIVRARLEDLSSRVPLGGLPEAGRAPGERARG